MYVFSPSELDCVNGKVAPVIHKLLQKLLPHVGVILHSSVGAHLLIPHLGGGGGRRERRRRRMVVEEEGEEEEGGG